MSDQQPPAPDLTEYKDAASKSVDAGIADETAAYDLAATDGDHGDAPDSIDEGDPGTTSDGSDTSDTD